MGRALIVENDPVRGTDTHNVSGSNTNAPPDPYTGTGDYDYDGAMTERLIDFVTDRRDERSPWSPAGARCSTRTRTAAGGEGTQARRAATSRRRRRRRTPRRWSITDAPLGTGVPNAGAGSTLLTVDGVQVLLDGDDIDTCSGVGAPAGSTVTATGQDFVTCSA